MRTAGEIIQDARDGKIPDHEECFWTMLALASRMNFFTRDLEEIGLGLGKSDAVLKLNIRMRAGERGERVFEERKKFMNQDPIVWLGDSGNPFSEENKKWRNLAEKIMNKALNKNRNQK